MKVQLFRIDDRLIHGQVVLGWAKFLASEYVILCDDEIAKNEWERELYLSCIPEELQARISGISETISILSNGFARPEKTIVLINSPAVLIDMIDQGFIPEKVNVGGLHAAADRKKYLPYVFLNQRELAELKESESHGVELYFQDVPNARIYTLSEVLALQSP
jgi:mannose/fructose/N-acetylgalactosamine-specific phosphotransferase system component IIB